jgi:hypothetical protein
MKKFNFWDFKYSLDDLFYELVNILLKSIFFIKSIFNKKNFMKKNEELKYLHKNKRVFVVGNGPSIKQQDLKLLKHEITFCVNRAYKHADYAYIQPTYHVFVDPKLASGEWEITMLDEVLEKNENVVFLLNAKWYYLKKFQSYKKNKKYKIYWLDTSLFFTPYFTKRKIDLTKVTYGAAVVGQAIYSSIYMGAKEIYLLGVEGNAFCHEMVNQESHFYGGNPENENKTVQIIYKELYRNYLYVKHLFYLSQFLKEKKYTIYNCTIGGVINMFERKKYEDLF